MRKASIRDLHIRTSQPVRDAAEGAVIVIERHGQPVAESGKREIRTSDRHMLAAAHHFRLTARSV